MDGLRVSVVIPVFNGGPDLLKCLDAIAASTYPVWECILVDDASTDGMVSEAARRHEVRVIELDQQAGPAAARNRGVSSASGDLVLFVDADVLVHPDALEAGVRVLDSDPGVAAVFGSYDDEPGHTAFLSQYRNLLHHWVHQNSQEEAWTFWSGCGLIRKDVLVEMGGFSTHYRRPSIEDIELGSRMQVAGHRIRLEKRMLCKHMKHWAFWNMLKTDIFQRGVPWTVLLLRNRKAPNDLNLDRNSRIATFLAGLLALLMLTLPLGGHGLAVLPAIAFLVAAAACSLLSGKLRIFSLLAPVMAIAAPLAVYLFAPDSLAWLPLLLVLLIPLTQLGFYRYSAHRYDMAFVMALIPMQVIFFLVCALSAALGIILFLFSGGGEQRERA